MQNVICKNILMYRLGKTELAPQYAPPTILKGFWGGFFLWILLLAALQVSRDGGNLKMGLTLL